MVENKNDACEFYIYETQPHCSDDNIIMPCSPLFIQLLHAERTRINLLLTQTPFSRTLVVGLGKIMGNVLPPSQKLVAIACIYSKYLSKLLIK